MVSNIMLFETVGYANKKLRNKAVFVSLHCYVVLSNVIYNCEILLILSSTMKPFRFILRLVLFNTVLLITL